MGAAAALLGARPSDTPAEPAAQPAATGETESLLGARPAEAPAGPGWASQILPTATYVAGRINQGLAEAMPPSLGVAAGRLMGLPLTPPGQQAKLVGPAPNAVGEFLGGVGENLASSPMTTYLAPGASIRGAIGAEAGHELFPNNPLAPVVGGTVGGATGVPIRPALHGTGIGGILLGEAGADWLSSALHSLGHSIAPETARLLAPLVGYTIPHIYNAMNQVIRHPLMLMHPAIGGTMGTHGGSTLERNQLGGGAAASGP